MLNFSSDFGEAASSSMNHHSFCGTSWRRGNLSYFSCFEPFSAMILILSPNWTTRDNYNDEIIDDGGGRWYGG